MRTTLILSPEMPSSLDGQHLISDYCDSIYRYVYSRVGNREDAEELTAEVFLKATRQPNSSGGEESVAQRLFTLARTALKDHWRSYFRHDSVIVPDDAAMDEFPEWSPTVDSRDGDEMLIQRVLDSLPDDDRRVLELRLLHGSSIEATAQELGLTPEGVKAIQYRALARATRVAEGAR